MGMSKRLLNVKQKIKAILGYIRRGDIMPFYIWYLAKLIWPLLHRDLAKTNAVKVMEEDWDYLIVLDACRYDTFKEVVDERAKYVISGGTATGSWMVWNFREKYKDVIYIAGNPHFASANLKKVLGFNPFYMVKEVWDYGWEITLKTVPPEEVTIAALDTLKKFPEKRLIIHYLQPHHPFLSDKELTERANGTWHTLEGGLWGGQKKTVWHLAREGKVSIERVKKAYKGNLKIVMKEVEKLKEVLPGRVILTSDHGNLFGEYGLYGHGGGLRAEGLVKVPWVILKDEKKDIFKEREIKYQKTKVEKERVREKIKKLKAQGKT